MLFQAQKVGYKLRYYHTSLHLFHCLWLTILTILPESQVLDLNPNSEMSGKEQPR